MSLNFEGSEDNSSLEDDKECSYNKWNPLGLCMDELQDDLEDKEECDISSNLDEPEDDTSLGSDGESFYSGDHIGWIGFKESDDDNWSTVSSVCDGNEFKEYHLSSVSTRYQYNMSNNESESTETPLAARAMEPRRAMTSVPRDMATKLEWEEAQSTKQLARADTMFGAREADTTVLLALEKACVCVCL